MKIWWRLRFWNNPAVSNYPGHLVKKTGVRTLTVLHNHDNREPPFHRQTQSKSWPWQKALVPTVSLTQSYVGAGTLNLGDSVFLYTGNHCYMAIHWSLTPFFEVDYRPSWNKGIEQAYYTATETIQNNTVLEPWNLNLYISASSNIWQRFKGLWFKHSLVQNTCSNISFMSTQ